MLERPFHRDESRDEEKKRQKKKGINMLKAEERVRKYLFKKPFLMFYHLTTAVTLLWHSKAYLQVYNTKHVPQFYLPLAFKEQH